MLRTCARVLVASSLSLLGCAGAEEGDDTSNASSDLVGTTVVTQNVARLTASAGSLTASTRTGELLQVSDNGTVTPIRDRSGYLAGNISFSFSGTPGIGEAFLLRKDASGVEAKLPTPFFNAHPIGADAKYFYFYGQARNEFDGERSIYRIGLEPGATPQLLGGIGGGVGSPDAMSTLVAADGVYWTADPNKGCGINPAPTCFQRSIGKVTDSPSSRVFVTPRLANGQYITIQALAAYEGDLYAASVIGVYKAPGGDLTKPFVQVCEVPTTDPSFQVKLTNSTGAWGPSRQGFAVSSRGFILPLQTPGYASALGLVKWSCATQAITPFGPAADGRVASYGLTQIADIVVRGDSIFWLDRQPWRPYETESFYALKHTKL